MSDHFDEWERSLLDWLTEHPPPPEEDDDDRNMTGVATCGIIAVEYMNSEGSQWLHAMRIGGTAWSAEGLARYLLRVAVHRNQIPEP